MAAYRSCGRAGSNSWVFTLHSEPEKSSLERLSAVTWPVLCPEAEVPKHRLLSLLKHFITLRGGGTLILVLLHCWSFLLCSYENIHSEDCHILELRHFVKSYYFLEGFNILRNVDENWGLFWVLSKGRLFPSP